jgi:hypothetical protein
MDQQLEDHPIVAETGFCPRCSRPKLFCDCKDATIVAEVIRSFGPED